MKGGLLSDSFLPWWLTFWRHASAIRAKELFDAIHRIATGTEPAPENLKDNAQQLLVALGINPQTIQSAQTGIADAQAKAYKLKAEATDVQTQLTAVLATLPGQVRDRAQDVMNNAIKTFEQAATTVGSKLTAAAEQAATTVVAAAGDIDSAYQKFEYWTCIGEERAQQWLTMHTRILTVVFAFIFAFFLQLDTVEIFKLVSSNKTVRDKLVAQAGVAETQAANLLGDNNNVLKDALRDFTDKQTDTTVKDALVKVQTDIKPTDTREIVRKKVADALKNKAQPVSTFDASVKEAVTKKLDKKAGDFKEVKADLDKTGFQLFPDSKNGRWGRGQGLWFEWWNGSRGHRWGILFSVALLSLGAPFWYHTLKDLMSLRSKVAENISDEQKQLEPGKPAPPAQLPPTLKLSETFIAAVRQKLDALEKAKDDAAKTAAIANLTALIKPKSENPPTEGKV